MSRKRRFGFTLAELLIALSILGIIAAFSIPKILSAQRDGRYNTAAHEAAAAISQAYSLYTKNTAPTSSTSANTIISQYLNYVRIDTTSQIDDRPGNATPVNCSGANCYILHSGGILRPVVCSFGGTDTTNAVMYIYDPDGILTGKQDSVTFFLYYNGRLTSRNHVDPGTVNNCSTWPPDANSDPSWFSW